MPNIAAAWSMDMCASVEAYTRHGLKPSTLAGAFASRAMASPIRLAAEPPLVRMPLKSGQPTASEIQDTTVRSIVAAAGAERHAARFWFRTDA